MVWTGDNGCGKDKETILASSQRERDVTFDRVFVPANCKLYRWDFEKRLQLIAEGTEPGADYKDWC